MISIYIIIPALVPAVLAKESMGCNLSGSIGAQQCFGALGKPLIFQLPINVTKTILKNKTHTILNARVNSHGEYISHSAFFANGTFMLNEAQRTDSGDYQLQTYTTEGNLLHEINMHLEIQAQVSKPTVSQTCLSPEQMIIRCSSEGDKVEFTLTLDGLLLVQTRGHSQSQTNWTANMKPLAGSEAEHKASSSNVTISLHGQLTGSLKCHVGNKVSRDETVVHLTRCEASISHFSLLAVAVIVSVVTLLLHAALFLCIKHLNKKTRPTTVSEVLSDNPEDEIVYSDVRVKKKTKTTQADPHLTVC